MNAKKSFKIPSIKIDYMLYVYIAYGFYLSLGVVWLIIGFINSGSISPIALGLMILFGAQFYYKHILTNLISGVVTLLLSIMMLLESLNTYIPKSKKIPLTAFEHFLITLPIMSIICSCILIFSFMKLHFKD